MINPPNELHFSIKNLGCIYEGEFTHKPLTVFCGPNNSGKTWAMYSLYHCYQELNILPRRLGKDKDYIVEKRLDNLKKFNNHVSATIPDFFNTSEEILAGVRFEIKNETGWKELIDATKNYQPSVFLMPAERNGLHLLFRELSARRTALLHHASKENINVGELLRDVIRSRYATPIADYINWLNNMMETQRGALHEFHVFAERLKKISLEEYTRSIRVLAALSLNPIK